MKKTYITPETSIARVGVRTDICTVSFGWETTGLDTDDDGLTDQYIKSRNAWEDEEGLW